MRLTILILVALIFSCKNNKMDNRENELGMVPITTSSEEAKKHFEKARFLVQNGKYK